MFSFAFILLLTLFNCASSYQWRQLAEDEDQFENPFADAPIYLKKDSKAKEQEATPSDDPLTFSEKVVAIQEYMEDFDKRPFEERDQIAFLLIQLEFQLVSALIQYEDDGRTGAIRELLEDVRKERAKNIPDINEVERLEWRVQFHLDIPHWWRYTSLCFKFQGDVPDKYCTGETPTCAPVGLFTDLYHDWSRNAGGCRVSWGLFADPDVEGWFKKTQMCLKYSHMCNDRTEVEMCAPANKFTEMFYDQTGSRSKEGGCGNYMAWALKVEDSKNTPAWLLNSKLCVKYRTFRKHLGRHDDGFKTKCAFVNEYTEKFEDKSYFTNYIDYREHWLQWAIIDSLDTDSVES